jgi:anti-sigma regulatory factor (Ser/Thr protein kinase)
MELECSPDLLAEVRQLADHVAGAAQLPDRRRYPVVLAVHEAVVNAMQHGCRFSGKVRIVACLDADGVTFTIADPGPPFALEPSASADLEGRGRGLLLIFAAMDRVDQNPLPDGKEIRLTARLRSGG